MNKYNSKNNRNHNSFAQDKAAESRGDIVKAIALFLLLWAILITLISIKNNKAETEPKVRLYDVKVIESNFTQRLPIYTSNEELLGAMKIHKTQEDKEVILLEPAYPYQIQMVESYGEENMIDLRILLSSE